MGFTGFYLVLPSFIGFYRVLLGFYWDLPSLTGFFWVFLCYRALAPAGRSFSFLFRYF